MIFFSAGEGEGESEARGAGGSVFTENPRTGGGGVSGGGADGAGRVSAANWGICGGGGGANFFFRGRNVHQGLLSLRFGPLGP